MQLFVAGGSLTLVVLILTEQFRDALAAAVALGTAWHLFRLTLAEDRQARAEGRS